MSGRTVRDIVATDLAWRKLQADEEKRRAQTLQNEAQRIANETNAFNLRQRQEEAERKKQAEWEDNLVRPFVSSSMTEDDVKHMLMEQNEKVPLVFGGMAGMSSTLPGLDRVVQETLKTEGIKPFNVTFSRQANQNKPLPELYTPSVYTEMLPDNIHHKTTIRPSETATEQLGYALNPIIGLSGAGNALMKNLRNNGTLDYNYVYQTPKDEETAKALMLLQTRGDQAMDKLNTSIAAQNTRQDKNIAAQNTRQNKSIEAQNTRQNKSIEAQNTRQNKSIETQKNKQDKTIEAKKEEWKEKAKQKLEDGKNKLANSKELAEFKQNLKEQYNNAVNLNKSQNKENEIAYYRLQDSLEKAFRAFKDELLPPLPKGVESYSPAMIAAAKLKILEAYAQDPTYSTGPFEQARKTIIDEYRKQYGDSNWFRNAKPNIDTKMNSTQTSKSSPKPKFSPTTNPLTISNDQYSF